MYRKISRFILGTLSCVAFFFMCSAQQVPPDLDAYVNKVIRTFDVPGISVAIVKDGRVVVAKGYGVKELGRPGEVDAHTLFCIASNSKAFTATALGMLVEAGKIHWNDPVINYLPWFRMDNDYVTSHMTIRDLLVHRSGLGLGASDLLQFPPSGYTRDEMVSRLRYVPLKTGFRSTFAYDNILYLVAGEVIRAVSGMSWEQFIKNRMLDKLGMTETIDRISQLTRQPNVAVSHAPIQGKVVPVTTFPGHNLGDASNPAGGVVSNAVDMARWLITQLDSGRTPSGGRLFDPTVTKALWSLVTPIGISTPPAFLKPLRKNFFGYGLGFFLQDYRGFKMVWHTGGLTGFVSRVTMIPELNLGICVLTNQESGSAFNAITYHILDGYLKAPQFDWIAAYRHLDHLRDSSVEHFDAHQRYTRDSAAGPSLPLEKYAGTYHDAWYGDIGITQQKDHLVMRFSHSPDLTGDLVHWQYDTFLVRWRDRTLRADAYVTFSLNPDGSVEEAKMKAASPATDFSYDFQDLLLKPVGKE
jgi:CubicO group peptidase (beta-lactamase class C family)